MAGIEEPSVTERSKGAAKIMAEFAPARRKVQACLRVSGLAPWPGSAQIHLFTLRGGPVRLRKARTIGRQECEDPCPFWMEY